MVKITRFTCENLKKGCVTDEKKPSFSFAISSDVEGVELKTARLSVNEWIVNTEEQISIAYEGEELNPFSEYTATLHVTATNGDETTAEIAFETGRMGNLWQAKWISDAEYLFNTPKVSPRPMTFRKMFSLRKKVVSAKIYATAMGIYELMLNGEKVGNQYFAPGFTSYASYLQYQTYDVTKQLSQGKDHTLVAVVSGGWAVGSFVFTRKNKISADRQALLLELRIRYEDGSEEILKTDQGWDVTEEGNYLMADLYDGETYDATVDPKHINWRPAREEKLRISPKIIAAYGVPVIAQEEMHPISWQQLGEEIIYDFGQNFAGVVQLTIQGKAGQVITVKHAEILNPNGTLNTVFLRSAKACATYVCRDGAQSYSPRFTYMGFRYISITGIKKEEIVVSAKAVYSELETIGEFRCSDERINRLQENIRWSAKSNFVEIPTDCPQRDERMGWTGDIALFAPTACYNFEMTRFLDKWLKDVMAEQLLTGGIPNTVPAQGYGFPATMPVMAVDFWGDACVLVPWALYLASGDKKILERFYPMMKKYVNACKGWASLLSVGRRRYIWHTPSVLHFGDWVAPDVSQMSQWQKRSKWTATASLCHTSKTLSKIAKILDKNADAQRYLELSQHVAEAYCSVFMDIHGKLKEEFQTAYVLPLYFGMLQGDMKRKAAENLAELVKKSNYCIGTGFPGTPYILFVLADNGFEDVAYRMLFNEKCPSWLYEVKVGATTIWERWDGLNEKGICPIGEDGTDAMISYNHYASGAVGDFFYRRILGVEPIRAGYKRFRIKPVPGGGLTHANGTLETPYGKIKSGWKIEGKEFQCEIEVPVGTFCELTLPNGSMQILSGGVHHATCEIEKKK